jgi:lysophospholipase L1-like esterase
MFCVPAIGGQSSREMVIMKTVDTCEIRSICWKSLIAGAWIPVAALLVLFSFTGCTRKSGKLSPLPPDAVVLAFGDSITYGTGASPGESYPVVLARLTDRTVINAGVPGEMSAEGLQRLPAALDNYRPALLLLCLGGNDFLHNLDDRQTADNVRAMVRLAKERGIETLLIGVPKPALLPAPPPFYREIAREFGVPYEGEVLKKILTDNSLKADYIHPNREGYKVLAETVLALMKKSGAL